jgi:DNA-binding transcriptional regulator/RsmH inhibitor MraZ
MLDAERDGTAWYCIPWPGNGLMLFTEPMFAAFASREEGTLTPDEDEQEFETSLFGLTERLEMDSAGRITIPKLHLELTRLGSDVVVVGSRYRLEVRDRATWTTGIQGRFERLALRARKAMKTPPAGGGATPTM